MCPISVRDIPGCSALNHLDLMNVILGVGTPDCEAILQDWPAHTEACCGFSFLIACSLRLRRRNPRVLLAFLIV